MFRLNIIKNMENIKIIGWRLSIVAIWFIGLNRDQIRIK